MEAHEVIINNIDEITGLLEERGITPEDVRSAIAVAESTGKKLYGADDENRFLTKARLEKLNVYAEYSLETEGIRLHTAFAHRVMLVSEDDA